MEVLGYNLDNYQMKAIEYDGNTLLIAGAGSGKTLTILGKIKYLIKNKKINEKDILCISFTNETVKSLKDKLKLMNYKNVDVYTFHKLSLINIKDKIYIENSNILEYIIDEYFKSYIKDNRKKLFKRLMFSTENINKLYIDKEYIKYKQLIITFIRLMKANDYDLSYIYNIYKRSFFNKKFLLKCIMDIYVIYKRELESSNKIDFDDMINIAIKYIKNNNLSYKYIIIDEFQDTSKVRFNLILEIVKYTNAKLFCVGDDFQSIYRFSGCDLELFINFKKYITDAKYFYLKNTYRNSQELINVSCNFVMKNKKQLKKEISSNICLNKPIIIYYGYTVEEIIKIINNDKILVLSRNNKDLKEVNWENKLTIHRAKGLECEEVILYNSDSIPTRIKNEDIIKYVINSNEYIQYEEERRLFYVALTRTKKHIHIIVNSNESIFVKEIIRDYSKYIQIKKK